MQPAVSQDAFYRPGVLSRRFFSRRPRRLGAIERKLGLITGTQWPPRNPAGYWAKASGAVVSPRVDRRVLVGWGAGAGDWAGVDRAGGTTAGVDRAGDWAGVDRGGVGADPWEVVRPRAVRTVSIG